LPTSSFIGVRGVFSARRTALFILRSISCSESSPSAGDYQSWFNLSELAHFAAAKA
jgi:hypothetical protein